MKRQVISNVHSDGPAPVPLRSEQTSVLVTEVPAVLQVSTSPHLHTAQIHSQQPPLGYVYMNVYVCLNMYVCVQMRMYICVCTCMGVQAPGFYLCDAPGDNSIVNITVLLAGENQLVINLPFYNLDSGESKRVSFPEQAVHRSLGGTVYQASWLDPMM